MIEKVKIVLPLNINNGNTKTYSPELVVKAEDRRLERLSSGKKGDDGRLARPFRDLRTLARR